MQLNEKGQGQEQLKVNVKGITGITASTSKGNQIKWRKGNLWIKADMQGYEGLAEEFASLVLDCTQIPHVRYKTCLIETSQGKYRGCCSQTMYEKGDSFYSISRLYETYGLVLERSRRTQPSIEIIENVIEFVKTHYMLDITDYLINTLYFDKLVANEDRHINNLGVIRKATGNYAIAPIFDNGLSFLAREEVWGKYDDFVYALNRVRYIPFGNKQVRALRKKYPNKKLIINKTKVYRLLNNYTNDLYPRYQVQRCKDILRWQLECSENCDNHFNFTSSNSNSNSNRDNDNKESGGLYWKLI